MSVRIQDQSSQTTGVVGALVAFSLIIHLLMLVLPIYSLQLFDRVLGSGSMETLVMLSILAVGALCIQAAMEHLRTRLLLRWCRIVEDHHSAATLNQVLCGPMQNSLMGQELTELRLFATSRAPIALLDIVWVPIYVVVLFALHPLLGGLVSGAVVALIGLTFLMAANTPISNNALPDSRLLDDRSSIRDLGQQDAAVHWWSRSAHTARDHWEATGIHRDQVSGLSRFLRAALQLAILASGAALVVNGDISPGTMIAASILGLRALMPVETAISGWPHFMRFRKAIANLKSLPPPPPQDPTTTPPSEGLRAEGLVYFPTPAKAPILRGLNLLLPVGSSTVILGASGSGKTCLAEILTGQRPLDRGVVQVDGRLLGGPGAAHTALVRGTPDLPIAAVGELLCGYRDYSYDDCVKAARLTGLHDEILQLSAGYDHLMDTCVAPIPSGFLFRLMLTRAVLDRPALVVFDSPEAYLDGPGLNLLWRTIQSLTQDSTVVVVLTRLQTPSDRADQTYVLNDGKLQPFSRDPNTRSLSNAAQ
ncbi:MAG: ATP-binding cassette domain-containing protein [Magnetovibrio sp.]|nr:ATP-binding cassette domain-containing protein [Magnetovibrio sp.]